MTSAYNLQCARAAMGHGPWAMGVAYGLWIMDTSIVVI